MRRHQRDRQGDQTQSFLLTAAWIHSQLPQAEMYQYSPFRHQVYINVPLKIHILRTIHLHKDS